MPVFDGSLPGLENDFTFYVCDHSYRCNKYLAAIISPYVAQMLKADICFSEMKLNPKVGDDNCEFQNVLEYYIHGHPLRSDSIKEYFLDIGQLLGNEEFVDFAFGGEDEISLSNIFERILIHRKMNSLKNSEIVFAAAHFMQIRDRLDMLKKIDPYVFMQIIKSRFLRIDKEDSLLETLLILGEPFKEALIYLEPENLSNAGLTLWEAMVENLDFSDMRFSRIFQAIMNTLKYTEINFDSKNPLNGIFSHLYYLKDKHINVSRSSIGGGNPLSIVGPNDKDDSDSWTKNLPNSYFIIDLENKVIQPTYYSVQTYGKGKGWSHMKNWQLQASNDKIKWVLLDDRNNNNVLNGKYSIASYPINCSEAYRYFRIFQTDKNHHNNFLLDLNRIELFGKMYRDDF